MTLLDIGCGWGGLAQFAAQNYGVSVHGVTISAEQQKLAQARCAGWTSRSCCRTTAIWIASSIASCRSACSSTSGQNYETYFSVAARNLKPDGLFLLHHRFQSDRSQRRRPDRQIHLPQRLPAFGAAYRRGQRRAFRDGGLAQLWRRLRSHADGRLENFKRAWPELAGGYSERFERMFTYYLNACAGAFRSRNIQLWQVLFSPAGVEGGCGSIADIPVIFPLHLCWLRLRAPVAYLSKFPGTYKLAALMQLELFRDTLQYLLWDNTYTQWICSCV